MSDIDIYENLDTLDYFGEDYAKLKEINEELSQNIKRLEAEAVTFANEIKELKLTQQTLTRNMSELFNTAKCELGRKDRTISDLRRQLDDVLFKRNKNPGNNSEIVSNSQGRETKESNNSSHISHNPRKSPKRKRSPSPLHENKRYARGRRTPPPPREMSKMNRDVRPRSPYDRPRGDRFSTKEGDRFSTKEGDRFSKEGDRSSKEGDRSSKDGDRSSKEGDRFSKDDRRHRSPRNIRKSPARQRLNRSSPERTKDGRFLNKRNNNKRDLEIENKKYADKKHFKEEFLFDPPIKISAQANHLSEVHVEKLEEGEWDECDFKTVKDGPITPIDLRNKITSNKPYLFQQNHDKKLIEPRAECNYVHDIEKMPMSLIEDKMRDQYNLQEQYSKEVKEENNDYCDLIHSEILLNTAVEQPLSQSKSTNLGNIRNDSSNISAVSVNNTSTESLNNSLVKVYTSSSKNRRRKCTVQMI